MTSHTFSRFPIEAVNWDHLAPTYPFRFNGPGYLYCMWCTHFVCLVLVSQAGAKCSECRRDLAVNKRDKTPPSAGVRYEPGLSPQMKQECGASV
jgi:hypothetical protein